MLYGREIIDFLGSITPLRNDDLNELYLEISSVMGVVFYSIFTVAVLEGFLFGLIVSVFGYDGLLLGIMYGFSSLIPLVGGVIMWIPVAGYEAIDGSIANALIILIYSIVVISVISDTFIKPVIISYINKKVVKTPTCINELLIFFSIIAGLATFGFWGMILGPAITAMFIAMLRLYGNLANIEESAKR
jgi:predicted PurR-regulated permease PerM